MQTRHLLSLFTCSALSGFALLVGQATNGSGNVAAFWEEYKNDCFTVHTASYLTESGWNAPTTLSLSTDAFDPEAMMNSAGDMLVLWRQNTSGYYAIYGAAARVGEAWSAPVQLSTTDSRFAEIGLDHEGNGVAVWQQQLDARNRYLATASFTPGSGWSAATKLSEPSSVTMLPELATGANGRSVAVWESSSSHRLVVQGAYYSAGAGWSAPKTLTSPAHDSVSACVGVSATGEALVVWEGGFGANVHQLGVVTLSPDGTWSAPVVISGSPGRATPVWDALVGSSDVERALIRVADTAWSNAIQGKPPEMALKSGEKAIVIWTEEGDSDARIQMAIYSEGSWSTPVTATLSTDGTWSCPVVIAGDGAGAHHPNLAMNDAGQAVLVWEALLGSNVTARARVRAADGTWSTVTELATKGKLPEAALNNSGKAIAIWTEESDSDARIKAAIYSDGSWRSSVYVSEAGLIASQPEVRMHADGSATVAWQNGAAILSSQMGADNVWGAPVTIN